MTKSGQDIEQVVQLTMDDIWTQLRSFETVIKENQDDKSKLLSKEKGSRKRKHNSVEEQKLEKASKNISHIVDACVTACSALECLNRILAIFGHFLNSNQHQAILTNIHLFAKKLVEASMWENPLWSDDYNLMESVCKVLVTFNSSSHHLHRSSINYTLSLLEMIRSAEPQNRQLCLAFQNNLETIFHYPRAPVVIVNPSSALLQEPEIQQKEQEVESSDEEEELDDAASVTDLCQDENEITSTVNGQGDAEKPQAKVTKEPEAIEIADEEPTTVALCISSEDEEEGGEVEKATSADVMEVVDIGSGDDESVEELRNPVEEIKSPKKSKVARATEKVDSNTNTENQASVDDIMSEFVDELV